RAALRLALVALEGQPVRLVFVQDVPDILDRDLRFGFRVSAHRQLAPGKENVPVLVIGKWEVQRMAFSGLIGEEVQRPEEQVLFLHLLFHSPQDRLPPRRILAYAIAYGSHVHRYYEIIAMDGAILVSPIDIPPILRVPKPAFSNGLVKARLQLRGAAMILRRV